MSVYQFVYSSVCLSISLFRQFVHLTFINPQSISLSIHLFLYSIHLSVYLPYSYQSIKSVCSLVKSIHLSICVSVFHPLVCLSPFSMSVSIHPNCFPHFQNITKHKTSSGDMFYEQITNVLMH